MAVSPFVVTILFQAPPTPPPAYTSPPKSACGQSIDVKDRGIDYGCSDQQPTECVTDHAFLVQLQCQSQSPPPLTASACC
ncbi:hypothetical protein BD310DRAFT_920188 [Dichomitus squalens]|uniref:Uncharacterized protein n=1 Tax=Dichomitus squalens TaxID=114155 RepID=A0A4Q9Q429_9APHY|nr:hypothetical protein BD310DRAFT_920188 [Dichomitus squalens]